MKRVATVSAYAYLNRGLLSRKTGLIAEVPTVNPKRVDRGYQYSRAFRRTLTHRCAFVIVAIDLDHREDSWQVISLR